MEKTIRKYGKVYRKALSFQHCRDIEAKAAAYESRLREMYASDNFRKHSVYPTTNAAHVYAVIAMCLELTAFGLTDAEIIEAVNHGFARRRNFFRRLIRLIDLLPNSFSIAKKWNLSDHDKRVRDGSITYDRFDVGKDRIEYRISKCVYIEMFETYGIRSLCKIFCMTDTTSYHNIPGDRQKYLLETLRTLKKGGTFALHDIFSKSRYGDMQAFVKKLRDMGYQRVELIDTTDGKFMKKSEAAWIALGGSALLTGRK